MPETKMDLGEATQCTQRVLDPRRMGRNNSGLSNADISDVLCILHPCSPAAFRIVASTADRAPQHVLQNHGFDDYDDGVSPAVLEEQETFILSSDSRNQAMDLALRFSTRTVNAAMGFIFGRSNDFCDIIFDTDTGKRVSNMHFRVFINGSGVIMLHDMSTNGTIVDDVILRGKGAPVPQTRMLDAGSIIEILSTKSDEIVKFIMRIPSREGHIKEYTQKFQMYMQRVALAEAQEEATQHNHAKVLRLPTTQNATGPGSVQAPLVHDRWGMHWNGGDRYSVIGQIGKGAFATVYQLATKSDGKIYAAKELEKRKFMKNGVLDRKLDNEMQIMRSISHPNIVQYVDYQDAANHLYIIMEFVPCGDLQQRLTGNGPIEENLARCMAGQVFDAMEYLHKKQITHRDIKPDNVLIANNDPANFMVKLSDFGLSKVVKDNETFLKTFCGTLLYCAPEVFPHYDAHFAGKGKKRARKGSSAPQFGNKFHSYSQSVDIWSFGAVLWFSLCCKPPFEGVADNTGRGMFDRIMMTPLDLTDLVKQGVSDDAVALLAEMLNIDPAARPSPSWCLQHRWFGNKQQIVDEMAERGLLAIAEEEESDAGAGVDVGQLSIHEHSGSGNSQYSEVSLNSGDIDFFDPRQSKRFKGDSHVYRKQEEMIESSPELQFQSIPIMRDPAQTAQTQPQPANKKLFGEISQSALDSQGGFGQVSRFASSLNEAGASLELYEISGQPPFAAANTMQSGAQSQHSDRFSNGGDSANDPDSRQQYAQGVQASPSLLGAESLVRELNMDSPHSTGSGVYELNEPTTPRTPDGPRNASISHVDGHSEATPMRPEDVTPKQPRQHSFSRRINLPIPASFYFDPEDPNTHNLEYASKVSGRDFLSHPNGSETSLPDTTAGSTSEPQHDDGDGQSEEDAPTSDVLQSLLPPPSEFIKPPPRLGRLVTTPDSFTSITLNITSRISTWGRAPSNTFVYPDKNDTRIPKRGIILCFHAKGIEKVEESGGDWTKLPDLHCLLYTESSACIFVNGVQLKKQTDGRTAFGRVYTSDEVVICPAAEGKQGLKFTCDFFHGEGKEKRLASAPRLDVRFEGKSEKSKGNEKETISKPIAVTA